MSIHSITLLWYSTWEGTNFSCSESSFEVAYDVFTLISDLEIAEALIKAIESSSWIKIITSSHADRYIGTFYQGNNQLQEQKKYVNILLALMTHRNVCKLFLPLSSIGKINIKSFTSQTLGQINKNKSRKKKEMVSWF